MSNIIPEIGAQGSFSAKPPFDVVCDPTIVFTVEAMRTPEELRIAKINILSLIGTPAGLDQAGTDQILRDLENSKGVVVTLIAPGKAPIHIPSSHFASFPVIDGVAYERYFLTVDLGVLPPDFKEKVNVLKEELADEVKSMTGVSTPVVHLGTIPTVTYVSRQQHLVNEKTRTNQITKDQSRVERIKELEEQHLKDKAYIALLEAKIIEASTKK